MSQPTIKQPTITLNYELYCSTISVITNHWLATKLFATKADKHLLITNSADFYRAIIGSKYIIAGYDYPCKLEDIYGSQFAKDVTVDVIQYLITGTNPALKV